MQRVGIEVQFGEDLEVLRRKFLGFKKDKEEVYTLKIQIQSAFEEAKKRGDMKVMEELEEMLMDLEFSLEENKCSCHKSSIKF